MEIAILVFFVAIFGGVLFLLALIYLIFRRVRKSRSSNRNFSSGSTQANNYVASNTNDDYINSPAYVASTEIYNDNSAIENQTNESSVSHGTAHDSPHHSENVHAHTNHSDYSAPPADTSYSDSSSTSYDSGSSSSSDSGSSSSDSGSSSSSSD
jgi:hypothetical protein